MGQSKTYYNIVLIILFGGVLFFPMIYKSFLPEADAGIVSENEKRSLQEKPYLDINYLDIFPEQYTAYFNDHFPFRMELLDFFAHAVRFDIFHKSPISEKIIFGQDGFLFQTENKLIYNGQETFSPDEIEHIASVLHRRAAVLAQKEIPFYLIIAPMKCDVYQDKLTFAYQRAPVGTRTDQLIQRLQQDSLLHLVDAKSALQSAMDTGLVFHKTDHHWSTLGAYAVYCELIRTMHQQFPVLYPIAPSALNVIVDTGWVGGLAQMSNLSDVVNEIREYYFVENTKAYVIKEKRYDPPPWFAYKDEYEMRTMIPDSTLPSVVVIRDSFYGSMFPFFSQNFSKTLLIFDSWQFLPNQAIIDAENPDAVILEIHEPFVDNLLRLQE
jgi:alginate O-acetyltransferase complex protein AlgJ